MHQFSDKWTFGLLTIRTNARFSDQWPYGSMTNGNISSHPIHMHALSSVERSGFNGFQWNPRPLFDNTPVVQSSSVVTRSNLSRYHIWNCDNSGRKWIRVQNHNRHPIPGPHGRSMGCKLWGSWEKIGRVITALYCGLPSPTRTLVVSLA